jgi:hypothetical protein
MSCWTRATTFGAPDQEADPQPAIPYVSTATTADGATSRAPVDLEHGADRRLERQPVVGEVVQRARRRARA